MWILELLLAPSSSIAKASAACAEGLEAIPQCPATVIVENLS